MWRMYHTLRPPVIQFDDGPKPVLVSAAWLNQDTSEAPADWRKQEFDDSAWLRGTSRSAAQTCYLSRLCVRGKFEVTDPTAVKDLKLSLGYYGGAIVYVNGQEIARANLAKDAAGPTALAEEYPTDAFIDANGVLLPSGWVIERFPRALTARLRKLPDVAIPAAALRKGTNVVAIELVRAPYHKIVDEKKIPAGGKEAKEHGTPYELGWDTCELRDVSLKAGEPAGLVPNAARPKGLQLWNSDFLAADFASDYGDRCEPVRPMVIKGVRNGVHSGKVVLGSPEAIKALVVSCTDLKMGEAMIPAMAVRIRYGFPWGGVSTNGNANNGKVLDGLLETPRGEFPVTKEGAGAVVPIWVTVKVPKDAKPGAYAGQLAIQATGTSPMTVPIKVEVGPWTIGDPDQWRTWVDMIESPDVLQGEYGVPFWGDKHFDLIGKALKYVGEAGAGAVYVPLIAQTNMGNEQSMVRWIKKDGNTYDWDFSVMDKYLDLAAKNIGKPRIVCFIAWEIYLQTPKEEVKIAASESDYAKSEKGWQAARWDLRGKGPAITQLDPATGKTELAYLPRFEDPASKPIWQALFGELRKRMEKRGWEKAMMLGMASDAWPNKEELTTLSEVSGKLDWVDHSHGGNYTTGLKGLGLPGYIAYVWNVVLAADPNEGRKYGWKRPDLRAQYVRFFVLNVWPPASNLMEGEMNIAGEQRGVGRIGADYWPTIKDKQGRRAGYVWQRYPQSLWHSLNLFSHMLVPGPDGPVATTRFENFREGIQECEARIAIEAALTDEAQKAKLGPDLAQRCQVLLDGRTRDALRAVSNLQLTGRDYGTYPQTESTGGVAGNAWYASTGWQRRADALYALAAEVAAKLAEK
jgi:hypothetical protein